MRNHHIAIQGSIASFHDLAARKYFGEDITIDQCGSFYEVCDKLSKNLVDYGIIAIENKVAGSILLNYQLIDLFDLSIIGETYLPIELNLLTKPGVTLAEIREIISHPMALGQCQQFVSSLDNVKITEFKDTSTSAKLIKEQSLDDVAVIAGPAVAQKYELETLVDNVCDERINYTRFYILSKGNDVVENPNKTSINLVTDNAPGSLVDILTVFKEYNLNVIKIQSVPIPNNSQQYAFHLDIEFEDKAILFHAFDQAEKLAKSLKIQGIYKGELLHLNN